MDATTLRNTLIAIGAIIMAIETGLKGAPTFRASLPLFVISEKWNFVPVILLSIAFLIWIVRSLKKPKEVVIKEPKPQESSHEQPSLTPLTVAQPKSEPQYRPINGVELLDFMESAKLASTPDAFFTPTLVKILCSEKGYDIAGQLARALILLNFKVKVNHDNASHLFTARPDQSSGITLRGQLGNRVMGMVGAGLSGAHLNCTKVEFPQGDEYKYTQIEIGDPTTDSYWDRSGP